MTNTATTLRIEAHTIPMCRSVSRTQWFVDLHQPQPDGSIAIKNLRVFDNEDEAIAWVETFRA